MSESGCKRKRKCTPCAGRRREEEGKGKWRIASHWCGGRICVIVARNKHSDSESERKRLEEINNGSLVKVNELHHVVDFGWSELIW